MIFLLGSIIIASTIHHWQVVKSARPSFTWFEGVIRSIQLPSIVGKAVEYSLSTIAVNSSISLALVRCRSIILRVPLRIASTVVILVSHVRVGLMRDPLRPVPSKAPYLVCPHGEQTVLCSHAAPNSLLMSNRGKAPQGVTSLSNQTFWKAISSIPATKYPVSCVLFSAGPAIAPYIPGMFFSKEFHTLANQLLYWIQLQVQLREQGRKRFFHCSWELNQYPFSTVMLTQGPLTQRLAGCSILRLSAQMQSISFCVKLSLASRVMIQVKSSPSQGSLRQQSSLFVQVFSATPFLTSAISATALILPVVSLKNTFLAFSIIGFQQTLSNRALNCGKTLGYFSSQTLLSAQAAQNISPLSRAGTLLLKSWAGSTPLDVTVTQGRKPANPGQSLQNFSKALVFSSTRPNTSKGSQISSAYLVPSSTSAMSDKWMDSLLEAVNSCRLSGSSSPVLTSTLIPSNVSPVAL